MCKRVPMAICPASGTTPVGIDRARNVPTSRPSAGWPSNGRACWPVTTTRDLYAAPRAQSAVAGQCAADDHVALSGRAGHAVHLIGRPRASRAQPGILAALHTWSQTLVLHPHVHCLVTGGGLTARAVGRGAPGISPPGPRGDGRLSGKMVDALRHGGAWGVGLARADEPAAVAQPPEPPGAPEEDEVERGSWSAIATGQGW